MGALNNSVCQSHKSHCSWVYVIDINFPRITVIIAASVFLIILSLLISNWSFLRDQNNARNDGILDIRRLVFLLQ